MNSQFSDYVTGTSFQLSLSRHMISHLAAIYNSQHHTEGRYVTTQVFGGNTSSRALLERGLITKMPDERRWVLTRAGELVIQLLAEAGLVTLGSLERVS